MDLPGVGSEGGTRCLECSGVLLLGTEMHPLSQDVHPKWSWAHGRFWVLIQCLRGCHGGSGGKLNNSWFYSLSVKTDFKETSKQKLTVWNIWTFFKRSNLLTSIQIRRRLLRCCFQAWYKMREKHVCERRITLLESLLPVAHFCPPKLSGSGITKAEMMRGKAV